MIHASLFSGIGGPEVAAAMLGWENAFHCEINPFGRAVLEYWFPESKSYEDITKTDFRCWRGRIDVLTGGFPCQPFSYAGKRGGREDDRYLWPQMLRAIDEIRPAWVVGENVAGITTMVEGGVCADLGGCPTLFGEGDDLHEYVLRQSFTIERICRDLEHIGYSVQPMLIPAAAVGAPHRRDRVFILAHSNPIAAGAQEVRKGRENPFYRLGPITDTAGRGGGALPPEVHTGVTDGTIIIRNGRERDVANAIGERLATSLQRRCDGSEDEIRSAMLYPDDSWTKGTWWDHFPTVSPVHRGNDGLPFPLDDLAIPQTKWRTESLKAYGNAIVPQVMYRIFQAIEQAS